MTVKKDFQEGDDLYAEELNDNFSQLQPANAYSAKNPAILTCGSPGALANFQAVTNASLRINFNGTDVELADGGDTVEVKTLEYLAGDDQMEIVQGQMIGQTFTTSADVGKISKIGMVLMPDSVHSTYFFNVYLYDVDQATGLPTGSPLSTVNVCYNQLTQGVANNLVVTLPTPVAVLPNRKYAVATHKYASTYTIRALGEYSTSFYSGGTKVSFNGSVWSKTDGSDVNFTVYEIKKDLGANLTTATALGDVATLLQTLIRTKPGLSNAVVSYESGVFKIKTSDVGEGVTIGYLQAPANGTSIIGPNFLNGESGVGMLTEGNDGSLDCVIKTKTLDGKMDSRFITTDFVPTAPSRAIGTVYQNTGNFPIIVYTSVSLYNGTTSGYYAQVQAMVGPTSSPATTVVTAKNLANSSYPNTQTSPITFIVPPGYYYKIVSTVNNGTTTLLSWLEANLFN